MDWSYSVLKYDLENNVEGLFSQMMNKFIKGKVEASGWQKNCNSDIEIFLKIFFEQEHVQLEYANMGTNEAC